MKNVNLNSWEDEEADYTNERGGSMGPIPAWCLTILELELLEDDGEDWTNDHRDECGVGRQLA